MSLAESLSLEKIVELSLNRLEFSGEIKNKPDLESAKYIRTNQIHNPFEVVFVISVSPAVDIECAYPQDGRCFLSSRIHVFYSV